MRIVVGRKRERFRDALNAARLPALLASASFATHWQCIGNATSITAGLGQTVRLVLSCSGRRGPGQ